jgi:putative peptidoglycan lipid II flippase
VTVFVLASLVTVSVLNAVSLKIAASGPATIQYAWLWYQLPYGVIAVALSTALFTEMSEASAAGDLDKLREGIGFGLRTTLFTIMPLAFAVLVLARQLAGLYHAGEFTADDVAVVAQVLSAWCLAMPFFAGYRFMYRVFSALRDLSAFIIVEAVGRVVQVSLYVCLPGMLGLVGLPLADAITHLLLLLAMLAVLNRKLGIFGLSRILADGSKCLLAAALAAAVPAAFYCWLGDAAPSGVTWSLLGVVGWGTFILVAYYWACKLMRVPEVSAVGRLLGSLTRRLRRRG